MVGACAVHHTINSGPVLSELFPTDAIGHKVLGEQDHRGQISACGCLKRESVSVVFTGVKTNVTAVYLSVCMPTGASWLTNKSETLAVMGIYL